MAGGLLSRVCGGGSDREPAAVEPWAAGAVGAGLSSLFVRLSPSAGDRWGWMDRSLALLLSRGPGVHVVQALVHPWG